MSDLNDHYSITLMYGVIIVVSMYYPNKYQI
jgi:hypothetical protein